MKFEEWIQRRLVAHGYKIDIDGAIGHGTTNAIAAFQKRNGIRQTGTATDETIQALRANASKSEGAPESPPSEIMPPWMSELYRRRGIHEKRDNAVLTSFLKIGKFLGDPAKLPWCGDAIETAIIKTLPKETVPNNPFWAQAWKDWGVECGPIPGAIGVIRWNARSGHVGIVANYDRQRGRVLLLGGNQSDSINLTWFGYDKFIAFRWPKSFPMKAYPALSASGAPIGNLTGTR